MKKLRGSGIWSFALTTLPSKRWKAEKKSAPRVSTYVVKPHLIADHRSVKHCVTDIRMEDFRQEVEGCGVVGGDQSKVYGGCCLEFDFE